ncbi:hypothetical protein C8F01DRAFT_772023 [Mycena amicta]|nr:hypothetical protein C8F01DRAFT_772023 [Mycena amicta]
MTKRTRMMMQDLLVHLRRGGSLLCDRLLDLNRTHRRQRKMTKKTLSQRTMRRTKKKQKQKQKLRLLVPVRYPRPPRARVKRLLNEGDLCPRRKTPSRFCVVLKFCLTDVFRPAEEDDEEEEAPPPSPLPSAKATKGKGKAPSKRGRSVSAKKEPEPAGDDDRPGRRSTRGGRSKSKAPVVEECAVLRFASSFLETDAVMIDVMIRRMRVLRRKPNPMDVQNPPPKRRLWWRNLKKMKNWTRRNLRRNRRRLPRDQSDRVPRLLLQRSNRLVLDPPGDLLGPLEPRLSLLRLRRRLKLTQSRMGRRLVLHFDEPAGPSTFCCLFHHHPA